MDQATRQKPSKAGERVFKTKTCNIPSLTELRKSLGYGHRGEEQDIAFKRALTAQVETFVSRDNLSGVSFTKWKTPAHQKGLREMTKDFLITKGKGPEFWPDNPNSSNRRPLEYTRDYEEIHRVLTKVFYRTAREHKRKQSTPLASKDSTEKPKPTSTKQPHPNKASDEQSSRQACPDSRGQSADNPIELDTMQSTRNASGPSTDVDPFAEPSRRYAPEYFMPPQLPDGIPPEEVWHLPDDYLSSQVPRNNNPTSNLPSHAATVEDPYQEPDSPAEDTHVPRDRGKRPAQGDYSIQDVRPAKVPRQARDNIEVGAGSSTRGPSSNNSSANLPSASNSSSSFAPNSVPSQNAPSADPPSAAPRPVRKRVRIHHEQTRASSRIRNQTQHPNFADDQTSRRAILTSSSEDEEQENERGPPRPTDNVPDDTSRHENPSTTAPRGNDTAPAAEKPSSKPRKNAAKKQAPTKKTSKPRAPRGSAKRGPTQESPAGPSTQRNSTQQQANGSSTSGSGTRQSQTGQPQTEQNQPARNNTVPSAEERQVIDSSSFFFLRHDDRAYMPWRPTANALQILFQMSLSDLMQDLGWDNAQTLFMKLDDSAKLLDDPYAANFNPGDNDMFNEMRRVWVGEMQRCYQRTTEPNLRFTLHFKKQKA